MISFLTAEWCTKLSISERNIWLYLVSYSPILGLLQAILTTIVFLSFVFIPLRLSSCHQLRISEMHSMCNNAHLALAGNQSPYLTVSCSRSPTSLTSKCECPSSRQKQTTQCQGVCHFGSLRGQQLGDTVFARGKTNLSCPGCSNSFSDFTDFSEHISMACAEVFRQWFRQTQIVKHWYYISVRTCLHAIHFSQQFQNLWDLWR